MVYYSWQWHVIVYDSQISRVLISINFYGCDPQTDRAFINNSFRYLQSNVHSALEYVVQIVFELFYIELPVQNYNSQCALLNE